MIRDTLLKEVLALPMDERRRLMEAIGESLLEEPEVRIEKRTLGLGKDMGQYWRGPDFEDDLLPEDWMDDSSDPLNWKRASKDSDE